jgi:hypothetical protein
MSGTTLYHESLSTRYQRWKAAQIESDMIAAVDQALGADRIGLLNLDESESGGRITPLPAQ